MSSDNYINIHPIQQRLLNCIDLLLPDLTSIAAAIADNAADAGDTIPPDAIADRVAIIQSIITTLNAATK